MKSPEVPKTVPLTARLRIEGPDIIVHDARRLLVDVLVENLPTKEWQITLSIERPVQTDPCTSLDLLGRLFDDLVSQTIEGAELIVRAIPANVSRPIPHGSSEKRSFLQSPSIMVWPILVQRKVGKLGNGDRRHDERELDNE